jgi:hypothetical protein
VLAVIGVTRPAWLLVLGFAGHGLRDLWQERSLTAIAAGFLWWESGGHGLDLLALVGCRGTVLEG